MRGRRDVRNTIFVPTPQTPESPALTDPSAMVASPSYVAAPIADNPGSDAQSIQSSHSLSSLTSNAVRHPEMHQPGLNASVVETVSTWFSQGQVTKAFVIGELALTHNATELASSSGTESIRLENFPVLEKVAPNPTFITQAPSRSGEYVVSLSNLARPAVAFKYQVHLEESNLAAHAPIALTPIWKIEAKQISVMLNYSFNPAFASALKRSVSLRNVGILIHIDDAKTISCQSKPIGTFSKEKSLIYWRLGDITLDGYAEAPQKLLARFSTESEAKQGSVEARWEISGEPATGLGSGLSLSQMGNAKEEGTDPFADESAMASPNWVWKDVPVARKLISGKYLAS